MKNTIQVLSMVIAVVLGAAMTTGKFALPSFQYRPKEDIRPMA